MSRYLSMIGGILVCLTVTTAAQTPSPEAVSAARGLVTTMKLSDQYRALLPAIVLGLRPIVAQDRPEIERDYDAMSAVIADVYVPFYNEMLEGAATVYASNFTAEELRQMDSFYRLPVGQKLLERSSALAQQTNQIGQDVSRKATDELRRRLTEALRQRGHKL
ncbi:DUF2059 domain-containing protein [Bradyrhizobium erythrophlei]|uniref:DUF2059 domain-containing protein n=1 Tax=Bradyrhizobium erythrophlei TaxID=1437360 RepID=UPI0035EFCE0B